MLKRALRRSFPIRSVAYVCIAFLPLAASAQLTPIPANDRDIDRIIAKIRLFEALARQCSTVECPKLDCAQAQELQTRLRDARIHMRYAHYWNKRAADSNMEAFKSVAGESQLASARSARIQTILAYQELVVNIASSLLDIASVGGNLDEIVNNPKLLDQKSYPEIAEMLDTFYEGMKDAESLHNRLKEARTDRDFPKPIADLMPALGQLSSDQMNDLKSTTSDIGSLIKAAQEQGKDWRKILKEGKGARSIGQIVGRIAKIYADAEIAERSRLVDSLLNDIAASDVTQATLFKELQRSQTRRNKAEDAYLALDRLIVIDKGNGSMTRCLLKLKCGSLDLNYASKVRVSPDVEVESFQFVTERDRAKSWGRALLAVNAFLPSVEQLLSNVPDLGKSLTTTLRLEKTTFAPGETFAVRFTAEDCLPANSWAGIVPSGISHGTEAGNSANLKSGRFQLRGASEGIMQFTAPAEIGSYDVRMNESTGGFEVTSVSFKVVSAAAKNAIDGFWDLHYGSSRQDRRGDNTYRFVTAGSSVQWGPVDAAGNWLPPDDFNKVRIGVLRDGYILTTSFGRACGYGPNGLKAGEERDDIPLRLIPTTNGTGIRWLERKVTCDKNGRMTITEEWDVQLSPWTFFRR